MRVLVAGATGFLGRHLVPALGGAGHEVMGTGRSSGPATVALRLGDPLPSELVDFRPEVVVDLAWEGIPDFSADRCRANVAAQDAFLAQVIALEGVRRVVVAGTCREYGDAVGVASGIASPVDDFGRAKDEVHRIAEARCGAAGVSLAWLRIFYVYGPGQRSESLLPTVLDDLMAGEEPRVRNPSAAQDFVAVADVATGIVASVEATGAHDVADLGSGHPTTVGGLVETAGRLLGLPMSPPKADVDGDASTIVADLGRAESVLGWVPRTTLEAGISDMVEEQVDGAARLPGDHEERAERT